MQAKFDFLNNFDAYVISYEVGTTKPSVKIYQELINKSGINAEEIILADDNDDNLTGAKRLGIKTFYYEGFDKYIEKLKEYGVNLK